MKTLNMGNRTAGRAAGKITGRAVGKMTGRITDKTGNSGIAGRRTTVTGKGTKLLPYIFLCVLTVICCLVFTGSQNVFGVKVDWLSQHSVLPDYFRRQFYDTGEVFPEFAGSLGGGQNIYYFSYYGLYSPIYLLSYALPFVKMGDYLMAVSIAGIIISVSLLYYWLCQRGFSWEISLPVSVLFLLAGPVIFQSCHQVMFVNYMPFLCMALLGVDRHFEKGRSGLYVVGVFLMIMSSFYFSIGGMMALALYGLTRYIEYKEMPEEVGGLTCNFAMRPGRTSMRRCRRAFVDFLRAAVQFVTPMIVAILMSGFLLAPTAYAILGRQKQGKGIEAGKLLMPALPLESLVHGAYGVGLTTLIITILITGLFYRKWSQWLLHGSCLLIFVIPFFQWVLNGGLYVRGKALIPFLPLLCYITAVYLEKQKNREIPFGVNIMAYLLTVVWLLVSYIHGNELAGEPFRRYMILAESVLFLVCFCIYWRYNSMLFLTIPSVICLLLSGSFFYGAAGGELDVRTYEHITDERTGRLIERTLAKEEGFWRLEQSGNEEEKSANLNRIWNTRQWISSLYSSAGNADYSRFRKEVFGVEEPFRNELMQATSENPLYRKLLGVKYIVGSAEDETVAAAAGYEPCEREGERVVYRSADTAPIAYATNRIVGEQDYDKLEFPCNQTALMRYAVVRNSKDKGVEWKNEIEAVTIPADLHVPEVKKEGLTIEPLEKGSYHIEAERKTGAVCRIEPGTDSAPAEKAAFYDKAGGKEDALEGTLVFLQFQVKNLRPNQDAAVWINGIRNKLSARNHIYYNGNTEFTYATALEPGVSDVYLEFGKGDYEILNVECFLADSGILKDTKETDKKLYQSPFKVDWEQTKGNQIQGDIKVLETGYFITSIPYDKGFEIFVDGRRTVAEKVNKAFLGCAVRKGEHQIQIVYHAPGAKAGKFLAYFGFILFFAMLAAEAYIFTKSGKKVNIS